MMRLVAAACMSLLAGCDACKSAAGTVGGTLTEWIACPTDLIDCGHVYVCVGVTNSVEICINDDGDDGDVQLGAAEAMYGTCSLTKRHQGLCKYCCPTVEEPCGAGCNALQSCWCRKDAGI